MAKDPRHFLGCCLQGFSFVHRVGAQSRNVSQQSRGGVRRLNNQKLLSFLSAQLAEREAPLEQDRLIILEEYGLFLF